MSVPLSQGIVLPWNSDRKESSMANEQMRPTSNKQAADPSDSYERSHPEHESGMGRLDNNKFVPAAERDKMHEAITHGQDPTWQINAEDVVEQRKIGPPQPDHS